MHINNSLRNWACHLLLALMCVDCHASDMNIYQWEAAVEGFLKKKSF